MRYHWLLVPPALVAFAPTQAADYLSVAQAQQLLFPGASFQPRDFMLSDSEMETLSATSHATVFRPEVRAWRVSTGGWFFLDQVPGRDDRITYAVGMDDQGAVKGIEILTCVEGYDGIRTPQWRAQFIGRRFGADEDLHARIHVLSGATFSSNHITDGVARIVTFYALFIANRPV